MGNIKVSVIIPVYNQEELVIRALDSIPKKDNIEIVAINDGSTDNTWQKLLDYKSGSSVLTNIKLLNNEANKGVAYTVNKGYDNAIGEYIVLLGSDDYFYADRFEEIMDLLDGTDLIYFNLKTNDGTIFKVDKESSRSNYVGSVKFMRKDFIGSIRCNEELRAREDYHFYQELLKKNPTEKFTDIVVKHYNFPRSGSLTDRTLKGEI